MVMSQLTLLHNAAGVDRYSVFEEALLKVARDADELLVASPYISIDLLRSYTRNVEGWRIITDLYSWASVVGKATLLSYLQEEHNRIRMVHGLHAKAIVTDAAVVVSSANLTWKGYSENEELGVLITDQNMVAEARAWFEHLWSSAGPLDLEKAIGALKEFHRPRATASRPNVKLGAFPRKSKLRGRSSADEDVIAALRHKALDDGIPKAALLTYLDLVAVLIEALDVSADDPRLVLSIPARKSRNYPSSLAATINKRYVLNINGEKSSSGAVGAIFPATYKRRIEKCCGPTSAFKRHTGEADAPPIWAPFFPADRLLENAEDRESWLRQAKAELHRGKSSPFKKHHEKYLYAVAMDLDLREKVLDDIYHLS